MALLSNRRAKNKPAGAGPDASAPGEDQGLSTVSPQANKARGPWDSRDLPAEVSEAERIDLGSLQVPAVDGMQVRLEAVPGTGQVVAVSLILAGSQMSLRVFAAPRSTGIWDEVRQDMTSVMTSAGSKVEVADGPFGRELVAVVPFTDPSGSQSRHDARFVGVDGPRWLLRADFLGPAATSTEAAQALEDVLAGVVVVRDDEPRPPREPLPLHVPGQGTGPDAEDLPGFEPLKPGPTIAEVR